MTISLDGRRRCARRRLVKCSCSAHRLFLWQQRAAQAIYGVARRRQHLCRRVAALLPFIAALFPPTVVVVAVGHRGGGGGGGRRRSGARGKVATVFPAPVLLPRKQHRRAPVAERRQRQRSQGLRVGLRVLRRAMAAEGRGGRCCQPLPLLQTIFQHPSWTVGAIRTLVEMEVTPLRQGIAQEAVGTPLWWRRNP